LALAVCAGAFFPATVLSGMVFRFANRLCTGCCDILVSLLFDLVDLLGPHLGGHSRNLAFPVGVAKRTWALVAYAFFQNELIK
jgi:hypothetical protein